MCPFKLMTKPITHKVHEIFLDKNKVTIYNFVNDKVLKRAVPNQLHFILKAYQSL